MATVEPSDARMLSQAILADARQQAEQILRQARQQGDLLLARASREANEQVQQSRHAAQNEGARRAELMLAVVPLEAERLRWEAVESVLVEVYQEARRRLVAREGLDYPGVLSALAIEAIHQMQAESLLVMISPEDYRTAAGLLEQALRRLPECSKLKLNFQPNPGIKEGGVILQDDERRVLWDNRLTAKLDRLWPELRRQLALQTGLADGNAPSPSV